MNKPYIFFSLILKSNQGLRTVTVSPIPMIFYLILIIEIRQRLVFIMIIITKDDTNILQVQGIVIVIIADVIIKTLQRDLIPKRTITVQIEIEVKFLLKVLMPKITIMELIVIEKSNPILSVIQQIQITVRDLFRESKLKMVGK